jgi:hypothetical protein
MKIEMKPLNLKEMFDDRYRVVFDESVKGEPGARSDPWNYIIPCRSGNLYPFSVTFLAFYCSARGIRTRLYNEHPEIEVRNWSDDGEAIFLFRPNQFDLIAKYAKPRRKRRLSAEHRKKLVLAGSQALESYRKSNSKCDQIGLDLTKSPVGHTKGQGKGL